MATMVPIISTCEIANCVTTNPLLSDIPLTVAEVILFFKASAGLNPERIKDGYNPAKMVTTIITANKKKHV